MMMMSMMGLVLLGAGCFNSRFFINGCKLIRAKLGKKKSTKDLGTSNLASFIRIDQIILRYQAGKS